jgi:ABC-type Na+ transport system ATPase subunit NatA
LAYFYRRELDSDRRRCTPGLRFYQRLMDTDRHLRISNQQRLRELKRQHGDKIVIFCSHDEKELEALQNGQVFAKQGQATVPLGAEPILAHELPRRPS